MHKLIMLVVMLFGITSIVPDADAARRLGGGSNVGSQRTITPPPKAPSQQQAAPATQPQQPAGASKWLGPLAGLAIGAALTSLFLNNGLAGALGGILMALLIAAAIMFAIRMFRSRMQPAGARPLQYAGVGAAGEQTNSAAGMPKIGSGLSPMFGGASAALEKRFPPGFDAVQFAQHAKLNFNSLQAANDARDLSTMRDYMTPALYAEIAAQIEASPNVPQKTEVVALDAEVIDVATENATHVVSVRFSGSLRHDAGMLPEPFSEVWHLEKPADGSSGWLISGIQQD